MTTVVFRVWPLGKDGDCSYGGTARAIGGRARPMISLPEAVMAREPEAAMSMSTMGVHERQATTMAMTAAAARTGMPSVPPRSVNRVTASLRPGLRQATAWSRTGLSRPATPSLSATAS